MKTKKKKMYVAPAIECAALEINDSICLLASNGETTINKQPQGGDVTVGGWDNNEDQSSENF